MGMIRSHVSIIADAQHFLFRQPADFGVDSLLLSNVITLNSYIILYGYTVTIVRRDYKYRSSVHYVVKISLDKVWPSRKTN